jgi:MFS transporter, YNFM family, putative membrane transport protein
VTQIPPHASTDMIQSTASWKLDTVIAVIAFLTVVDLFATQAILPSLTKAYGVSPAAMGTAVNASTLGMAIAGLLVGSFSQLIDRRRGVVLSLALLSVPTALLSVAPDLTTFAILRVLQGLCMSAAFTLTLAYLADETCGTATSAAIAAYITGNVASNLFGRLLSASVADSYGLSTNFIVFAALNLLGAGLVYVTLTGMHGRTINLDQVRRPWSVWRELLAVQKLRAGFGIGFCILFAFIGTFTYVNFVLVQPPISLGMMSVGLVYLVFLPSIFTTPLAGWFVDRFGVRATLWGALATAGLGLPLLLAPQLSPVAAGLTLIGVGTFLAQATATGFVSRAARPQSGAASGLYLACYFLGGLAGSAILGQIFVLAGWPACVAGIGASLAVAAYLAASLKE